MAPMNILIVGCGIAGPTLASFLLLADIPPTQKPHITILERASEIKAHLRGQNIDIRGAGVPIIRKLGIETLIRSSTTGEEGVRLVDRYDRVWASAAADKTGKVQTGTSDIEILRGTLAEICWKNSLRVSDEVEKEGTRGVECIFGDYLDQVEQDDDKVHVRFAKSGQWRTYDLVVGADGLQSQTRKLVWGSEGESERLKRLGMYAGFFSIPRENTDDKWRRWFHAPGRRGIMLRPDGKGVRSTIFMYVVNEEDSRFTEVATKGVEAQKALLEEYFLDAGWESPRIVREMKETDDFYYDMVAQVKMDKWHKGRVVLLADAGYCASPISGMGTTLAFTGAYNLAGALKGCLQGDDARDLSLALSQYEEKMRPVVDRAQKLAPGLPRLINPKTAWGILMLHLIICVLSWTRILFLMVKFLGKFISGPAVADMVKVEEYGFRQMPDWKPEEADKQTQQE